MSIEAALAELTAGVAAQTAATKELTDITNKLYALRADAIETVRGAAASPGKAKDKPAEKPAEKTAAETVADDKPAASESMTEVQRVVGDYVGAEGISEEERKARKGKVAEVLAHPKVNAKKVSEIPAGLEKAVIKAVTTLAEKGNVLADEPSAEDEDEPDLMG